MENEVNISSNVKNWIIVIGVAVLTFIIVFFLTYKLLNGNKKKQQPSTTEVTVTYSAYKSGDSVTLTDNSKWHVLYDSEKDISYISLLSDENVNTGSVLYGNVTSLLKGTYKQSLIKSLSCDTADIQDIRFLAYLDLATLSKSDSKEYLPETDITKFNIPEFIYAEETVTDTVYQTDTANYPVMLCKSSRASIDLNKNKTEENSEKTTDNTNVTSNTQTEGTTVALENRFCLGDPDESLPVRPVLVINKKYIIGDESNTKTKDTNTKTGDK